MVFARRCRECLFVLWSVTASLQDLKTGCVRRRLSAICALGMLVCIAFEGNTAFNCVVSACVASVAFFIVRAICPFGVADIFYGAGIALVLGRFWTLAVLMAVAVCSIFMVLLRIRRLAFIPFIALGASLVMLFTGGMQPLPAASGVNRVAFEEASSASTNTVDNSGETFEFVDQNITDILYAISLYSGIPVTADDTVSGKTSFRFSGGDNDQAFDTFLAANRLYVSEENGVLVVSKVRIIHSDNGSFQLDAYDIKPALLFDKVSVRCAVTVIYDLLPASPITVHISNVSTLEGLKLIASQIGGYMAEEKDNIIYVSRIGEVKKTDSAANGYSQIKIKSLSPETYDVDVENAPFSVVLEKLFTEGRREYCTTCKSSVQTSRALFSGKDFNSTLALLCTLSGCSYAFADNVYYIFDGSNEKLNSAGKSWQLFSLKYITLSDFMTLFQSRFKDVVCLELRDLSRFLCLCSSDENKSISDFIELCDVPKTSRTIALKYITTDEFLSHLPPSVDSKQFSNTGRKDTLFFYGTEDSYNQLLKELEYIDKPVQCIRYDLLVIQYQTTSSFSHKVNASASPLSLGDRTDFSAVLGSVLSLNVDVVSVFGVHFAAELEAAISENEAKVFADTTLHGISGSSIDFQNTNTFRYRDSAVDPDTGKTVNTGVTREIVAGLMLNIQGWVSGDGMITTKVKATVSRRGADTSADTGNPPPTSEKSISTEVRSRSGEPVVLSGLVQDDSTIVEKRIPLISKIPLIGLLFKSKTTTDESSEMVIYLVPYLVEEK